MPSDTLDHVFSFCVLEHIRNLHEVLLEVRRILKPGGQVHVSVNSLATITSEALIGKHHRDNFVLQYFNQQTLREELQSAGLEVASIFPILTGEFARQEFERRNSAQLQVWLVQAS